MISRLIDWCARNRFLVFTGTALLVLAGIWSMRNIPIDALPDISDVEVIVHTGWAGEPPNIIEDQVTYPIVSTLLAAPRVKAVRAQTMFGDSYVYVVFEDGTDLYWARSRVLEYLQQIQGRLPEAVHPSSGRTRREQVGSMNTPSLTIRISTVWLTFAVSRIGICGINSKLFPALRK
jgi:Cu(I)/Ag(I) efflux system membrane protein CusA/SilA